MAIPKYDDITLPLLQALNDGQEYTKRHLTQQIIQHFNLTPEEQAAMLPSTRSTYIKHRTGWAAFALRKAGLATNPKEGTLQITDEGRKFLATNPTGKLNRAAMMQFEPFKKFIREMRQCALRQPKRQVACLRSRLPRSRKTRLRPRNGWSQRSRS